MKTNNKKRNAIIGSSAVILLIFAIFMMCNFKSCSSDPTTDDPSTSISESNDPSNSPDSSNSQNTGDNETEYTPYLIGEDEIELLTGDIFTDEGIEIIDQNGVSHPELLKDVIVKGEVDTSKPGTYVITYTYGDIVLRRTVHVSDEEDSNGNQSETPEPGKTNGNGNDVKPGGNTPGTGTDPEGDNGQTTNPSKPAYDMSGITFNDLTVTYDGRAHYMAIGGKLPQGVKVTFEGNGKVNAGTYTVVAHFVGSNDYQPIPDMSAKLTIKKAVYDMSSVEFNDCNVQFDGEPHSILVNEDTLPKGVKVSSYTGNGQVKPGEYTVTAYFVGDSTNYESINPLKATLTIIGESTKPSYDMSGVTFNGDTVTYDGEAHSIYITGKLPSGVTVYYTGNGKVNAGAYKVTAHFVGSSEYQPIPDMEARLFIKKADYDMSGISFSNKTFTYDGRSHSIYITGKLPEGVKVAYDGNSKTAIGTYQVVAIFTGDSNHNSISPMTAKMTIKSSGGGGGDDRPVIKPSYDMSGVLFTDKTVTYNGLAHSITISGKLPDGVTVSYTGNAKINAGTYTVTAHFNGSALYNPIPDKTATLTINKATLDKSKVTIKAGPFTYDGTEHTISATTSMPGVKVEIEGVKAGTAAGTYHATVIVTAVNPDNYTTSRLEIPVEWKITGGGSVDTKKDFDPNSISVDYTNAFTYDGNKHSVSIKGNLPKGVTLANTSGATETNAGSYTATFTFNLDPNIYKTTTGTKTVEWKINPATLDESAVKITVGKALTYTGSELTAPITVQTLKPGLTYTISGNTGTAVGPYSATVTVKAVPAGNYAPSSITINNVKWEIVSGTTPDTRKSFDEVKGQISVGQTEFTYNGSEHVVTLSGKLPEGVTLKSATGNKETNASNSYTATFTFDLDTSIYKEATGTKSFTWKISPDTLDESAVKITVGKALTYTGSELTAPITVQTLKPGLTYSIEGNTGTAVGPYSATVTVKAVPAGNYTPSSITITNVEWEIVSGATPDKKSFDEVKGQIGFGNTSFTYNGSEHEVTLSGSLPEGVTFNSVTGNTATNASDSYTATFTFDLDTSIYKETTGSITVNWSIAKANIDTSQISFPLSISVVKGTDPGVSASYPSGIGITGVSYTTGSEENGKYTITASFSVDNNHNKPSDMVCTVTITDESGAPIDPGPVDPPIGGGSENPPPVDDGDPENPSKKDDETNPPVDDGDPENPSKKDDETNPPVDEEDVEEPASEDEETPPADEIGFEDPAKKDEKIPAMDGNLIQFPATPAEPMKASEDSSLVEDPYGQKPKGKDDDKEVQEKKPLSAEQQSEVDVSDKKLAA